MTSSTGRGPGVPTASEVAAWQAEEIEQLRQAQGRYLSDLPELIGAFKLPLDKIAAAGSGTWSERRALQKAREPYLQRAVMAATRCIGLARWLSDATPSDPEWGHLTQDIDEFFRVFDHGLRERAPRVTVLVEVEKAAALALRWRYVRAQARAVLKRATKDDLALVKRGTPDLRAAASQQLGSPATAGIAEMFVKGKCDTEDFPEREAAQTVVFTLSKALVSSRNGAGLAKRLARAKPKLRELLREWPSRGGPSRQRRTTGQGHVGKWELAAEVMRLLGLGNVQAERLRQDWQEYEAGRKERTKRYRGNL